MLALAPPAVEVPATVAGAAPIIAAALTINATTDASFRMTFSPFIEPA
jgi:hypothetical protein